MANLAMITFCSRKAAQPKADKKVAKGWIEVLDLPWRLSDFA